MSEWAESCVSEVRCRELVELGYMPEKPLIGWRAAFGEAVPKPRAGEAVVFADFFERGFSVPTSPFFRRLLRHYGLQLHHLNPNGILHISIFITLCEAYLGIEPHFGLWKWLYCVRPVSKLDPGNGNAACAGAVGGASVQLRPKAQYISIPLRMTNKGWQARWFYCRNEKPSLPEFVAGHCPVKLPSWSDPPTADEMDEVDKIIPHLNGLFQSGLDGALLIATFLSRRIQPIKKRCHPMSEFTGCSDPTRERLTKLTLDEILSRVDQLLSTDTDICTDGKPLPYHHKRTPKNDLSKCLSATMEEDNEGADMPQATDAVTIASYPPFSLQDLNKDLSATLEEDEQGVDMPQAADTVTIASHSPLKKPRTLGAGSSLELVQQKAKEVVARSYNEMAQQRESGNSALIAQPLPDDEDTEAMSHRKKRKSAEVLTCSTPDPGLQDLPSLGTVAICKRKKKLLSKDVMLPCLLSHSSASQAKEVSASASKDAADLTFPHREEMPDNESVSLSPPQAASPSPTPQSEPCPLQSSPARRASPTTTLPTLTVPESIKMTHVPCQPPPCDNLGSSQQSVEFATDSVQVEGEVHGKKAEEPGMLSVQMEDMESNLIWEIDDDMEPVEVEWKKVKEAATSFETRLAEITLRFKIASKLIVKLKQENKEQEVKLKQENKEQEVKLKQEYKDLEVKLKQENKELEIKLKKENETARAFEKKVSDLSKELDIVRADRDSLSQRFQDAKKKAADLCDAFNAPCDKLLIDNSTRDGVEVVTEQLGNFPTELTDEAVAADGRHCRIRMQLALATRG